MHVNADENEFLAAFRTTGLATSNVAMLLASCFGAALLLFYHFFPAVPQGPMSALQMVRATSIGLLLLASLTISCWPDFALRNYILVVGLPSACGVLLLSAGSWAYAIHFPERFPVFIASLMFAYWLCYTCTRLPTNIVLLYGGISELIVFLAAVYTDAVSAPSVLIHLTCANILGFTNSRGAEVRERELYFHRKRLIALNAKLMKREADANRLSEQNRKLVGLVSHDLQQPVAGMSLYLSILQSSVSSRAYDKVEVILASIQACMTALEQSLTRLLFPFGQAVCVVDTSMRGRVNIITLLHRMSLVFENIAQANGVLLRVRISKMRQLMVHSDEPLLWRIVSNLVSNSIKFRSPEGVVARSWVVVHCVRLGDCVRLDVYDNGIGFDCRHQDEIFASGVRLNSGTETISPGYGLGLESVREAVADLPNHRLVVRSAAGRGTRFSLYLPMNDHDDGVSSSQQ